MIKYIIIAAISVLAIILVSWYTSTNNKAIDLETKFSAAEKARQTTLDNMWKKIQSKYQLKNDYASNFKQLIEAAVVGRQGGQLLKFSVEQQPQLSTELYKDVMATIDGERDNLKNSQDLLADIKREHDNLRLKFPSSIIVGSRPEIKYVLVTSTNTQAILKTGNEDSITLH